MGKEEGHKPRRKAAERGTECLLKLGQTSTLSMWLRRRDSDEQRFGIVQCEVCFQLSVIMTTRWHRSASFIKVRVFTGKTEHAVQHAQLGFF